MGDPVSEWMHERMNEWMNESINQWIVRRYPIGALTGRNDVVEGVGRWWQEAAPVVTERRLSERRTLIFYRNKSELIIALVDRYFSSGRIATFQCSLVVTKPSFKYTLLILQQLCS